MGSDSPSNGTLPKSPEAWRAALADLPSTPDDIPAFFFGHGSPMLAMTDAMARENGREMSAMGPRGPLANFLRDFGPTLLEKYKPKGIAVFSAHWETYGQRLVTDYGDENPLLYDYFGFQPELYELQFKSRGDAGLTQRIVQLYTEAGDLVRTTNKLEKRGHDGRGFEGPGLDHGVFVPFRLMFGDTFADIPIVQVSIDGSLSPEKNWAAGRAVRQLRKEGILVLSGGLTIHNLRDFAAFSESTAAAPYKAFDKALHEAVALSDPSERQKAMVNLTRHPGFRAAHPLEEHFIPLYVAAGAGEGEGDVRVISAIYGAPTFAFGVKSN